jgi:ribonuclease BN (tRNA processing enzyme)
MQLTFLGTAGYHPTATRQTACLVLPQVGVVLDGGTGFFRMADYLQTDEIDIFLSHAHLDHVVGLTYWFDVVHRHPLRAARVHGMEEKVQAIRRHLLNEHLFPAPLPYEYRPLTGPVALPQGGQLTYFPLAHPGGAIGYRLDWPGHSLAYVTDTTATANADYARHVQGVNVLIHECNFNDDQCELAARTGHSCVTPVAELARDAGVGRLILTHVNPLSPDNEPVDIQTARRIFANTQTAHDNMTIDF